MTAPRPMPPATLPELSPDLMARVAEEVRPHLSHLRDEAGDDSELRDTLGVYALVAMMSEAAGQRLDVREAVGRYYIRHGTRPDLEAFGVHVLEELAR